MHLNSSIKQYVWRYLQLFLGFAIIAVGISLSLLSQLGMNPWGTFHDGLTRLTGFRFGTITQLVGLLVIILGIFLKIYPGTGTILNMISIGFFVDLLHHSGWIPSPSLMIFRIIYMIVGAIIFNYGIFVYLRANLGAGPRDGLFLGLSRITHQPVSIIRPMIEITVLIIGILLGGTFGIGTLFHGLLGGLILHKIFEWHHFSPYKA